MTTSTLENPRTSVTENVTVLCAKKSCTEPEFKAKLDIPLCYDHFWESYQTEKKKTNELISKLYENGHAQSHLLGTTYIIRLPNGNVKIGTTTKDVMWYIASGIKKQMKEWGMYVPGQKIEVLATINGGETLERLLHLQFSELRILGPLEQFTPTAELLSYARTQGFVSMYHNTTITLT